jgi:hypothetical protein
MAIRKQSRRTQGSAHLKKRRTILPLLEGL